MVFSKSLYTSNQVVNRIILVRDVEIYLVIFFLDRNGHPYWYLFQSTVKIMKCYYNEKMEWHPALIYPTNASAHKERRRRCLSSFDSYNYIIPGYYFKWTFSIFLSIREKRREKNVLLKFFSYSIFQTLFFLFSSFTIFISSFLNSFPQSSSLFFPFEKNII